MRDRQSSKLITGINVHSEKREYVFQLMDAETSTRIFHEYAGVAAKIHDTFIEFIVELAKQKNKGLTPEEENAYTLLGTDENVIMVLKKLPEIFTWDTVSGLAKDMLCGHVVKIGDKDYKADENGFIELAGDPMEMYTALLYALEANYPSYITPLKLQLVELFSDDSTPDSGQDNDENETPNL